MGNCELFDEVLETLQPFGDITGKAMFGGYGFWERGHMFALIDSGGTLYFKADETTRGRYRRSRSRQFAPRLSSDRPEVPMPYWSVPRAVLHDPSRLTEWVTEAIAVGHATAKGKHPKRASKRSATAIAPPGERRTSTGRARGQQPISDGPP